MSVQLLTDQEDFKNISSLMLPSFLYWRGIQNKTSELATSGGDLISILQWYKDRRRNQYCSLAAARTGVVESRGGLWPVWTMNCCPRKCNVVFSVAQNDDETLFHNVTVVFL